MSQKIEPVRCSISGCTLPPEVSFTWPTSRGTESAILCNTHSRDWWDMFKNTNAGQGLQIRTLLKEVNFNKHEETCGL